MRLPGSQVPLKEKPLLQIRSRRSVQLRNYLFLLPFFFAYRPLFLSFDFLEMTLYTLGLVILWFILTLSNQVPQITLTDSVLIVNTHSYRNLEYHPLQDIHLVEPLVKNGDCRVYTRGFKPVHLSLTAGDFTKLRANLEERGVPFKNSP